MVDTTISKSSQDIKEFLEETQLSKKELAHMVGVSQSYIYNLIEGRAPFTSKRDLLERLAVIMDKDPREFDEYQGPPKINPYYVDNSARAKYLEIKQGCKITNLDLIRKVPPELQLKVVDILRCEEDIPPDITFIEMLLRLLNDRVYSSDSLTILEAAIVDAFKQAGTVFNKENTEMIKIMVNSYMESR